MLEVVVADSLDLLTAVQHRYPQHVFEAFVSALQQFEMERISEMQLAVSCAQLLAGDRLMLQRFVAFLSPECQHIAVEAGRQALMMALYPPPPPPPPYYHHMGYWPQ